MPSKEPAAAQGDLLDLLGGLDMNAGSEPPKPVDANENKNALDFFNNDNGGGALGNAASANAQSNNNSDPFNFNNSVP